MLKSIEIRNNGCLALRFEKTDNYVKCTDAEGNGIAVKGPTFMNVPPEFVKIEVEKEL